MDKLTQQLKVDAARIDVAVSDELDHRIEASLAGITPVREAAAKPTWSGARFWWASSLTGIAAALAMIAFLNIDSEPQRPPATADMSPVRIAEAPLVDWKTESATLTRPLEKELEDLRSDIKKAEAKVKREIGL